ncbi:unnamed protein product [Tilletia laevis]|uniref:Uncharacterized protein n=1 Tax=Tilletia laevis TaxID=157183 RepID=A0A9N8LGY2_9BASI|nr:unnamed protein product [Tilletia caries]CAD6915705.1 unnamed protein product [Tilletia laevis]CAD6921494.1 unnamed protein product [Tilletia laevis]CAD6969620.1 unnamed protein product [Tilletia controversa]
MNPREDLVREALGDATLLIPYILGEDLASLPAEFTSAPVLERKRWLGNPSAADSAAGSSLTSQLYAPAGSSQDDLDSKTEAALHDFRLFAERAVFPARHEANSSSSSGGTRSQRIVSPLLTQRPRFRRPQPDVLLSAVPLPLDEDAAATGQKTGRNALTLLLLYEPNHQPSTPTFTFLNLLPFPLQSLPGVWNEDVQAPTASQGHSPSDNAPAQEYHNDGDDFWSGVDSDSSSTRSKDAPQHVEEADEDERYWAQYNDVQETGDGDNEQGSMGGREVSGGGLLREGEGRRPAQHQPTHPAVVEPRWEPERDTQSHDSAAVQEVRSLLGQAWARMTEAIPSSMPHSAEARRTMVFTLLAEAMREE